MAGGDGVIKRAAYIGLLTPGQTSRMRAEWLRELTPGSTWDWIDTNKPMLGSARVWQSLAYRFQRGKAIERVNAYVMEQLGDKKFDLIWVDKAVFLTPPTMKRAREASRKLVHFTPDTAFGINASRYFETSIGLYDLLVTTKSFDMPKYEALSVRDRIHVTTQGFDPRVHYPRAADSERRREVVFVGLAEKDRKQCLIEMIRNKVPVRLAGHGWTSFVNEFEKSGLLHFEGTQIVGESYATLLSRSWVGLGLLSKRFAEASTTRTFEIPACGAILGSERTGETEKFFDESEAILVASYSELAQRIKRLFASADLAQLSALSSGGRQRVLRDGRDYPTILSRILSDSRLVA